MLHSSPFARRLLPGLVLGLLILQGCSKFVSHTAHEYVYVWVRGTYLRDRVAPVSNRVAEVTNGERLQVVEHGRRFLKVKTDKGDVGWIEEHGIIDQATYDRFTQMAQDNAKTPVIATAVLREDYWLRDAPGRTSDRFYLIPENEKLQLLKRASVPRPTPPQALPAPLERSVSKTETEGPVRPNLEDYWLVRDSDGRVGWVRGRTLDENVPDAIAGLAEGQKIVGAYVLRKVSDPGAGVPGGRVPEYVAFLAPWKDGLPYDFDQVRVFTWNTRKHRYETAYRERNIAGYLPVSVTEASSANQETPMFSFRIATNGEPTIDPQTGMVDPGNTATEAFRMDGVVVHRIGKAPPRPSHASSASRPRKTGHRNR